jgi:molecular chaperone DnaK
MALDNKTIGRFQLTGIMPAPRGIPQIEVTFDIDANGILNVSAKDKATGKEQSIRIEASSGLSQAEIDRMVKDAERHESEDKTRRDEVEVRNKADQMVYQAEKNLTEFGDKIDPTEKAQLEAAIQRTKAAVEKNDVSEMRSASEELTNRWHQAAAKMYQQTQGSQAGQGPFQAEQAYTGQETSGAGQRSSGDGTPGQEGSTVDADYEVVD